MIFALLFIGQAVTYQDRLMGQRALGMGGAFTAIADDPSASYYNPAGLTNLHQLQLEIGLPILGFELQRIEGGLIPQLNDPSRPDLNGVSVLAYPTTVGAAVGLGIKDAEGQEMIAVSATLMIPWQKNTAFRQTFQADSASAFALWQENEQTMLIGPGIGVRVGRFSFGLTVYYMHHNFNWINSRTFSASDRALSVNSVVEGWTGGINPRLGFMLRITPKWSIGLMLSLSSHRVWGDASSRVAVVGTAPGDPVQELLYDRQGIKIDRPLPWEARIGVGYQPSSRLTLSADVSLYAPQRFNYFPDQDDTLSGAPSSVRRNFIMNGNIGAEYWVKDTMALRFGLFTNLTSADRPSDECLTKACMPWVNTGGFAMSVGFMLWRVLIDLGLNATVGIGSLQQFLAPANYVWTPHQRYGLQFFVGGNIGKVINSSTEELKKVLER